MAGYRTVVAGTDGSESSYRAVDRAAEVARDAGATLVLVCAYRGASQRDVAEAQDALGDEAYQVVGSAPAEATLSTAADRAAAMGATSIEREVFKGDPADGLVEIIQKRHAELLVVCNRGLNSLAGRLLGSVPASVARRAACDVLIVHTTH